MTVSLILLALIIGVGAVLYVHDRMTRRPDSDATPDAVPAPDATDNECCGLHITCEKDSLLASVSDTVEYYDDEELDRFRGRDAENYDASETEEFRDILLTLLPQDIAGWARSLQLRGINLPPDVREELLLVVREARVAAGAAGNKE